MLLLVVAVFATVLWSLSLYCLFTSVTLLKFCFLLKCPRYGRTPVIAGALCLIPPSLNASCWFMCYISVCVDHHCTMAKPYCCRSRLRLCLTLILFTAVLLFSMNMVTQLYDIPPNGLSKPQSARHHIIDSWRQVGAWCSAVLSWARLYHA